jgi:hypothetical protein
MPTTRTVTSDQFRVMTANMNRIIDPLLEKLEAEEPDVSQEVLELLLQFGEIAIPKLIAAGFDGG